MDFLKFNSSDEDDPRNYDVLDIGDWTATASEEVGTSNTPEKAFVSTQSSLAAFLKTGVVLCRDYYSLFHQDGDSSTFYLSSRDVARPWLKLDLGETHVVRGIMIKARADSDRGFGKRMFSTTVRYSATDMEDEVGDMF